MFRCQVVQKLNPGSKYVVEEVLLCDEDSDESRAVEPQNNSKSHSDPQFPSTSKYLLPQDSSNQAKLFKSSGSGSVFKSLDSISTKDFAELNMLFAKFLIENNISFDVVRSKYLNEFLKKLRPAYKIPDTNSFTTTITDQLYANAMMNIRKESTDDAILILTKENDKFIAHVKTLFGQPVYLSEIDCVFSATEAVNSFIQEALNHFNHKIKSLVEDCLSPYEVDQTELSDLTAKSHSVYIETVITIASDPQLTLEVTELLNAFNIVSTPNKDR